MKFFFNSNDQGFVQSVGLVALRNLFYLALGLAHAAAHFSGTGNTEIEGYEPMGLVLGLSQWLENQILQDSPDWSILVCARVCACECGCKSGVCVLSRSRSARARVGAFWQFAPQ